MNPLDFALGVAIGLALVLLVRFIMRKIDQAEQRRLDEAEITPELKEYLEDDIKMTEAIFEKDRKPWEPQDELYISSGRPVKVSEHPNAPRRDESRWPAEKIAEAMKEVKVADWSNTVMMVHSTHVIRYASGWGYCIYCNTSLQGDNKEKLEAECDGPPDR